MNTTLSQIIQLDTYFRGTPQTPDADGRLILEVDESSLRVDPDTGACWDGTTKLDPDIANAQLLEVHTVFVARARKIVMDQHAAARAAFAADGASARAKAEGNELPLVATLGPIKVEQIG